MESISCSQSSIWIKVTEFKKLSKSFCHDLSLQPLLVRRSHIYNSGIPFKQVGVVAWQHPDQWHFIP